MQSESRPQLLPQVMGQFRDLADGGPQPLVLRQ
jgi:hypothetical protein